MYLSIDRCVRWWEVTSPLARRLLFNRPQITISAMENLGAEQEIRLSEAMPNARIAPPRQAQKTAFSMGILSPEQELRPSEASLKTGMTLPQMAKQHRICSGEPEPEARLPTMSKGRINEQDPRLFEVIPDTQVLLFLQV